MLSDIRYALRILRKNRAFSGGSRLARPRHRRNTAIFTLIDNVILRALPSALLRQLAVLAENPTSRAYRSTTRLSLCPRS